MSRGSGTLLTVLLTVLLTLLAVVATACGDASGNGTGGGPDRFNGEWRLVSGTGPEGEVVLGDGVEVTLEIDGATWGGEVCNQYGAEEVSVGDGTVQIGDVIHTEMACENQALMEAESIYLAALDEVDTWEVADDRLTLTGPDTELVFERVQRVAAAELVGTAWLLDTLIIGQGASATASSVKAEETLMLHDDGMFEAGTGCNYVTGSYERADGNLVTGGLDVTEAGCEDRADQHDHVVSVPGADPTVETEAPRLTLTSGDLGLGYTAEAETGPDPGSS